MKNSPSCSSFSSLSSSTTSSSSSVGSSNPPHTTIQLLEKPKTKRTATKKNLINSPASSADQKNAKNNNAKSCTSSARRSSIYRGVTRHRWTGRYEAHLWDKHTWNNIQNKKGRQVYLGAYDSEEAAARTYDLAALKYWGPDTSLNFPIETYQKELEEMHKLSKEEYLASLRRQSSGFSRGVSKYRGVARHHHNGRWEARIGRVLGNKYLYLGTYSTQEEAAAAYDMAAIQYRGASAVTNFDISNYADFLKENALQSTDQQPQLPNLNSQTNIQQEVEQQQQNKQQEDHQVQQQEKLEPEAVLPELLLPSYDSLNTMAMTMDPLLSERDFLNWSLCLDTGFDPHQVLDFPLEMTKPGELPDLFYDTGFEDNIVDFLFETGLDENEVNNLACLDNEIGFGGCGGMEVKAQESLPSSSYSSTTTSLGFL